MTDYLKMMLQYALPKQTLSILAGLLARVTIPRVKNYLIGEFIKQYDVNMQEALAVSPSDYADFNAFFIRKLKSDARPIADADVICPVDGYVSEIGTIQHGQMLQAKGRHYRVDDLLATDLVRSASFHHGSFATLYLSPKDYHRVHMPMEATLQDVVYVPGSLFSVQPATTRCIPRLFARNERLVVFFETRVGTMAMVLVGATIVGAIGTSWQGEIVRQRHRQHWVYDETATRVVFKQADEMGYFKLGSTVILLFADDVPVRWNALSQPGSCVRMGQSLGVFK